MSIPAVQAAPTLDPSFGGPVYANAQPPVPGEAYYQIPPLLPTSHYTPYVGEWGHHSLFIQNNRSEYRSSDIAPRRTLGYSEDTRDALEFRPQLVDQTLGQLHDMMPHPQVPFGQRQNRLPTELNEGSVGVRQF